jgi:hypothetical protein
MIPKRPKLWLLFFLCALLAASSPALKISIPFTFFAPFLIISFYHRSLIHSLYYSLAAAIFINLLGNNEQMGATVISYSLASLIVYRQKQFFFDDKVWTLPVMVSLFSLLHTIFSGALLPLFETIAFPSASSLVYQAIRTMAYDLFFTSLCFSLPPRIISSIKICYKEYKIQKEKKLSN